MEWLELSVKVSSEYVEVLSELFHRYGGNVAVEESGGHFVDESEEPYGADSAIVKTYIPSDSVSDERRNRIDLGVRLIAYLTPISGLCEKVLQDNEWHDSWKQHFHPLHIGKKLVIVPTWHDYKKKVLEVVIELDPGMAFGTGHHPTTRMCLELIEEFVIPGVRVADLGCGSGILSIASAKLGAGEVIGLEIDPIAVEVARSNVEINRVDRAVRIDQGELPSEILAEKYDVVVANISTKVIVALANSVSSLLLPGGRLIVSGILSEKKDIVSGVLMKSGLHVGRKIRIGDWISFVAELSV